MRIYFRHLVCREDPQQLAQSCVTHTVSLLQRTLPDSLWRVRAGDPWGGCRVPDHWPLPRRLSCCTMRIWPGIPRRMCAVCACPRTSRR
jgi:hypothetical protein